MVGSFAQELHNYVNQKHREHLHLGAFNEIAKVFNDFIALYEQQYNKFQAGQVINYAHWVCNAAPGHAKTTVLTCILKMLATQRFKVPALLVFNNTDTMRNVFEEVARYLTNMKQYDVIRYVDTDNVEIVQDTLDHFQFVCITQQRLRDIALGMIDFNTYGWFRPKEIINPVGEQWRTGKAKRLTIIDEMPILFDDCIFDISSKHNAVDWFDSLAKKSKLNRIESYLGRSMLSMMISKELLYNVTGKTKRLIRNYEGSEDEKRFMAILSKLNEEGVDFETLRRFNWFKRLLEQDNVGCIDEGSSILCSQRIDYRPMGNILILDGTSTQTKSMYKNEYQFVEVKNYHDYRGRFYLHWRDINTSVDARGRAEKSVQTTIAEDMKQIRNEGVNPFPLMAKQDIKTFISNGVITEKQRELYKEKDKADDQMPLNLLNTTGKNVLAEYNSLALTNLPIRPPQYYKLKAIGLYGVDVEISNTSGDRWFKDEKVQNIFEELMMGDLLQIMHRSSLRYLNRTDPVHIYMYHNRGEWMRRLKNELNLADANLTYQKIHNDSLYNFMETCQKYAEMSYEYCQEHKDEFNEVIFSPLKIGGRPFKDWINKNWRERKESINKEFDNLGLEIKLTKHGTNEWKMIGLK